MWWLVHLFAKCTDNKCTQNMDDSSRLFEMVQTMVRLQVECEMELDEKLPEVRFLVSEKVCKQATRWLKMIQTGIFSKQNLHHDPTKTGNWFPCHISWPSINCFKLTLLVKQKRERAQRPK